MQALKAVHAQAAVIVKLTAKKKAGGKGKKRSALGNMNYWRSVVKTHGMTGAGADLKVCVTPGAMPLPCIGAMPMPCINRLGFVMSRLRQVHRLVAALQFNL